MNEFLWVEKYRPITVESCVLPSELKETFGEYVKNKSIPNLVLSGGPGVGKTTVAKAMIKALNSDKHQKIFESDQIEELVLN